MGGKFGMSGSAAAAIANIGDSCKTDYLIVSSAGSTAGATTNYDRLGLKPIFGHTFISFFCAKIGFVDLCSM